MDKELFDRDINATPDIARRLAHGLPNAPAENMTFAQLYAILDDFYAALAHTHSEYAETGDLPVSENLTWNLTGKYANLTVTQNVGRSYGKVVYIDMLIKSSANETVVRKVGSINRWTTHNVYFPGANTANYGNNLASYGYVDNAGNIYVLCPHANEDFAFNVSFITE